MTTEPLSLQGVLAVNVHASSPAASGAAGGAAAAPPSSSDKPAKPSGLASVASTANQILFKNELYTSMKQKTMDQELMATLNKIAQENEKRRFEDARAAVARLVNKRKVLVGVGDMTGQPGSDPDLYSSASFSVDLTPGDTVRDVKKKLIAVCEWTDENPEDFELYDDVSEEPLKDALPIEAALSASVKPPSAGRSGGGGGSRRMGVWVKASSIRLPPPYVGLLWAAKVG